MDIKRIQEADLENKKVLLRVDFNVSLENGHAKETFKIEAAKESLKYLLNKKAKVALMSYFGRPDGKVDPKFSMEQLVMDAENILGVNINFISDCIGDKVKMGLDELKEGEILMLENVRFYPGEDVNDDKLAKEMAEPFEVFVNDAFSQSHRNQSSITGITKYLPSCAGFRLLEEIHEMNLIKDHPIHPAVAIIGGAKIETKLPVIKFFEKKYEHILVGGKIANEALDQKIEFSDKVVLPIDFVDDRLDIGPKTVEKFKEIIAGAKTIAWNGPTGKFEDERYAKSSNETLDAVIASGAFVLVGGGETLEILEKNNAMGEISFVSTGGGAMLDYLSNSPMPGIEVLQN